MMAKNCPLQRIDRNVRLQCCREAQLSSTRLDTKVCNAVDPRKIFAGADHHQRAPVRSGLVADASEISERRIGFTEQPLEESIRDAPNSHNTRRFKRDHARRELDGESVLHLTQVVF